MSMVTTSYVQGRNAMGYVGKDHKYKKSSNGKSIYWHTIADGIDEEYIYNYNGSVYIFLGFE